MKRLTLMSALLCAGLCARDLTWSGGNWNMADASWRDAGGNAATFASGDNVTFAKGGSLTLTASVSPGDVTFDIPTGETLTLAINVGAKILDTATSFRKTGGGTLAIQPNGSGNNNLGIAVRCGVEVAEGFVELELLLALVEAPHAPASPKGRRNPKVVALVERMQASPEMNYPLEEMAREAALSTVALNDAFKRATGLPPHAFLLDCRLKKGCELLRRGESVGAVSHRLGFSSPRHFATALKRATGRSPRDFRA